MEESKLYNALKKVYDLTGGAYGDPVIQEDLYYEMENALEEHETFCKSDDFVKNYVKEHGSELTMKKGALMNAVYLRGVADGYTKGYEEATSVKQKNDFYNFITWYNAKPKAEKPNDGLITITIINEYLKQCKTI